MFGKCLFYMEANLVGGLKTVYSSDRWLAGTNKGDLRKYYLLLVGCFRGYGRLTVLHIITKRSTVV